MVSLATRIHKGLRHFCNQKTKIKQLKLKQLKNRQNSNLINFYYGFGYKGILVFWLQNAITSTNSNTYSETKFVTKMKHKKTAFTRTENVTLDIDKKYKVREYRTAEGVVRDLYEVESFTVLCSALATFPVEARERTEILVMPAIAQMLYDTLDGFTAWNNLNPNFYKIKADFIKRLTPIAPAINFVSGCNPVSVHVLKELHDRACSAGGGVFIATNADQPDVRHTNLNVYEHRALDRFTKAMHDRLSATSEKGDFTRLRLHPFATEGVGYLLIDKWHKLAGSLNAFDNNALNLDDAERHAIDIANYALMIYQHVVSHKEANNAQTTLPL